MLVRGDLTNAAAMYDRTAKLDPSIALAHFQLESAAGAGKVKVSMK